MSGIVGGINLRSSGLVNSSSASDGQVFTGTGAGLPVGFEAAAGGGMYDSIAIIADHKGASTYGGAFTNGAWRTRDLNTEVSDADGIVSISSNQFTLQAGTYTIFWGCVGYYCGTHQSQLYNVTDSATTTWGPSVTNHPNSGSFQTGSGVTTIGGAKAFEIRHKCDVTNSDGFGVGIVTGMTQNTFVVVTIHKHS